MTAPDGVCRILTIWATTRTQRFGPIAFGAGMVDWTSYYTHTCYGPGWIALHQLGIPQPRFAH